MCEAYPCPPPRIEADADWYRIIFSRPEAEGSIVIEQVGTKSGVESGAESKMALEVLSFMKQKPLSKSEIAKLLGKSKPTRYLNDLMARLVHEEYLEYTIPEKPNSRLQKYRLMEKGCRLLEQLDKEGGAE